MTVGLSRFKQNHTLNYVNKRQNKYKRMSTITTRHFTKITYRCTPHKFYM